MEWSIILLLAAVALAALFPAVFVWYVCIGGICQAVRQTKIARMACSVDKDCPPGYVCMGGHCVPQKT